MGQPLQSCWILDLKQKNSFYQSSNVISIVSHKVRVKRTQSFFAVCPVYLKRVQSWDKNCITVASLSFVRLRFYWMEIWFPYNVN